MSSSSKKLVVGLIIGVLFITIVVLATLLIVRSLRDADQQLWSPPSATYEPGQVCKPISSFGPSDTRHEVVFDVVLKYHRADDRVENSRVQISHVSVDKSGDEIVATLSSSCFRVKVIMEPRASRASIRLSEGNWFDDFTECTTPDIPIYVARQGFVTLRGQSKQNFRCTSRLSSKYVELEIRRLAISIFDYL